jgi:anti-sigma B factor antagonist
MTTAKPVVVKALPEILNVANAAILFRELAPLFESDHPRIVFDFSAVRYLDSGGVELLLRCMEEAMKRNGDLKLAAITAPVAVILEITRVDRLFEIYDNCSDAVESYHRFPTHAVQAESADPSLGTFSLNPAQKTGRTEPAS